MKLKFNKILLLFISFLFCFSILAVSVKADSGWDSDYDSSYDSDWDSSDWDSSGWDSDSWDSDSSGEFSKESFYSFIIFLLVIGLYLYIVDKYAKKSSIGKLKKKSEKREQRKIQEIERLKKSIEKRAWSEEQISKYLHIPKEELLNKAIIAYREIQLAWSNFDYDTLRKYTSDELFNMYKMQLEALKMKKQRNVMADIVDEFIAVIDITENQGLITVKMELIVSQFDYVVNEKEYVIKGNSNNKMLMHYELTYVISENLNAGKCPNCGAKLSSQASNCCDYCDSIIISNNHDLVLTKKQKKGQY